MKVPKWTSSRKKLARVVADGVAVALSFVFALAVRFDFAIPSEYVSHFLPLLPAIVALYLLANYATRIYSGHWKFASFDELLGLTGAAALSTMLLIIIVVSVPGGRKYVPFSVAVMGGVVSLFTMAFVRLQYRLLRDRKLRKAASGGRKVLLVGAGEAGEMVVRDMQRHPEYDYCPIGFIDDDPSKSNLVVKGVPVLGSREKIPEIARSEEVDEILITLPSATGEKVRGILPFCEQADAKIKILPSIYVAMAGEVGIDSVRELRLEDLLGRAPCKIDLESVAAYTTDKVVMVTGAGGSIGSELSRQICELGPRLLIVLDRDSTSLYDLEMELRGGGPIEPVIADVRDAARIDSIFKRYGPQIVFHSAALKHVPMLEAHPSEAVKNNIMGTQNVAEAGIEYGAERFILISTDKAVNPVNVMGATKRISEFIIGGPLRDNGTLFSAVRFGNVLGSRGSVVPLFMKQIEKGGPVLVTHPEATRYFMTIEEAAQLVIQAGAYTENGDLFLLDMGEPVRILELAQEMVKLLGKGRDIDIRITGLRPGEKLNEQLLFQAEEILPTPHPKIHRVESRLEIGDDFDARIDELADSAVQSREDRVRALLSSLVPSYQPGEAEEAASRSLGEEGPGLKLVN